MTASDDVLRRVERVCAGHHSSREMRSRLVELVREQIPFDGHVFSLTDPVSKVGSSPHANVPMLPWPRLPELIRWRYLTSVNRADLLVPGVASSLLTATASPSESLMWRHVQREIGVVDTAIVAYGDRYGDWGFLELWRTTTPFSGQELDLLTAVAAPVAAGIRASLALTFVDDIDVAPIGPAVVLLGPDLQVRGQTEGAAAALMQLLPPGEELSPVPAAAYNVGAALIAHEAGVGPGEPWTRIHLGGNCWVTVKASRLGEDIAISIEPSTPGERLDLVCRTHGLSERESEVLRLLSAGLDTRQVASTLFVSEHTATDHVKALLHKTGAANRQLLLARILGTG